MLRTVREPNAIMTVLALVLGLCASALAVLPAAHASTTLVEGRTTLSCPAGSGSTLENHVVDWRLDTASGALDLLDDITPSYFDLDWISVDAVARLQVEGAAVTLRRAGIVQSGQSFTGLTGLRAPGSVARGQSELVGLDLVASFHHPETGEVIQHELVCTAPAAITGTVAGRVDLPDGVDRGAVSVVVGRLAGDVATRSATAAVAADGTFSIAGVSPSTDLRVWLEDSTGTLAPHAWGGVASPFQARAVAVDPGRTTSGIVLRPAFAATLGGRVALAPGESSADGEVRVLALDAAGEWTVVETLRVGADLRYRTVVEAGRDYRVDYRSWAVGGTVWAYGAVRSATSAGAATIRLTPGEHRDDVDVVRPLGTSVSGRVLLPKNHPAQAATISLAAWVDGATSYEGAALARLGADGRFTFAHVAPGDYVLVADSPRSSNAAWLSNANGSPRIISVAAGRSVAGLNVSTPLDWNGPAKLRRVKSPKVSGTAKVGKTLKASKGTWRSSWGAKVSVKFQWETKKGKKAVKVKGATKSKLKLGKKFRTKQVRLKVTVSAKDHPKVTHTTKWSKKVR